MIYSMTTVTNGILSDLLRKGITGDKLLDIAAAMDTEFSSTVVGGHKCGIMYLWTVAIEDDAIYGRTWDEYASLISMISAAVPEGKRLVLYVHNLSCEFQFLRKRFQWRKVFAVGDRKVVQAVCDNGAIEYRCSYLLTGKPLSALDTTRHHKRVGSLDYRRIRHSLTPLTDDELCYAIDDVLVITEYIRNEIVRCCGLANIPLTKTGYVRRALRKACISGDTNDAAMYRRMMTEMSLTPDEYRLLRGAFAGGYTHASDMYVGSILHNVGSYDMTSAYPSALALDYFPMSRGVSIDPRRLKWAVQNRCCLIRCRFGELRAAPTAPDHIISESRCEISGNSEIDNGRVVYADILTTVCTELDLKHISRLYTWKKMDVSDLYVYRRGRLPKQIVDNVLQWYRDKTILKGSGDDLSYRLAKEYINSVYGMCATDPVRTSYVYDRGWRSAEPSVEEAVAQYNKSKSRFIAYPWAVWVTAHIRDRLWTAMEDCGDYYVYSDTDSCKLLNPSRHADTFARYNAALWKSAVAAASYYNMPIERFAPADKEGRQHPLGAWEYEGTYNRFRTWGAKRYITEDCGGIHLTVAGVGKKAGERYLSNTYDDPVAGFNSDLTFPAEYDAGDNKESATGKLSHYYQDNVVEGVVVDYMGISATVTELSSLYLDPSPYHMSLAREFIAHLGRIHNG